MVEDPGGDFTLCAKEEERREDEAAARRWMDDPFLYPLCGGAGGAHGDSAAAAALFLVFKLADLASLSLAEGEQARELAIPLDSECREQSHFSSNTRWC